MEGEGAGPFPKAHPLVLRLGPWVANSKSPHPASTALGLYLDSASPGAAESPSLSTACLTCDHPEPRGGTELIAASATVCPAPEVRCSGWHVADFLPPEVSARRAPPRGSSAPPPCAPFPAGTRQHWKPGSSLARALNAGVSPTCVRPSQPRSGRPFWLLTVPWHPDQGLGHWSHSVNTCSLNLKKYGTDLLK